jgi:hypothetical protein
MQLQFGKMNLRFDDNSKPGLQAVLALFGLLFFFTASCGIQRPGPSHATGPLVVYKTKKDYREHVSVQLSEDGRSIVAFPGRTDVRAQRPVELAEGYLLKRMVGNAFLSITIEEYAASTDTLSPEDLRALVIDKKPYLEIYECSACSDGDTTSLNQLIRQNALNQCKSLR